MYYALALLISNIFYFFKRYFISHALFFMPYGIVSIKLGYESFWVQAFGIASIVAWFSYGYVRTSQKSFVVVIGVLFTLSQFALYAGMRTLDLGLSLACIGLMVWKMYLAREQNRDWVLASWSRQTKQ